MVTRPKLHRASTTVGELREFFEDEHVHMALLVEDEELIGTIERADLDSELDDREPARLVAALKGRTIDTEVTLADALQAMRRAGRRRLAVTTPGFGVAGLLCLKSSGLGFCSDTDVAARRAPRVQISRSTVKP
jgi:predicted transcriptional regulator